MKYTSSCSSCVLHPCSTHVLSLWVLKFLLSMLENRQARSVPLTLMCFPFSHACLPCCWKFQCCVENHSVSTQSTFLSASWVTSAVVMLGIVCMYFSSRDTQRCSVSRTYWNEYVKVCSYEIIYDFRCFISDVSNLCCLCFIISLWKNCGSFKRFFQRLFLTLMLICF